MKFNNLILRGLLYQTFVLVNVLDSRLSSDLKTVIGHVRIKKGFTVRHYVNRIFRINAIPLFLLSLYLSKDLILQILQFDSYYIGGKSS